MSSPSRQHRGLTLMEVAVSMVVMTILLAGMTSAIVMTTHALPNSNKPLERLAAGSKPIEMMVADLETAITVTTATATAIEFTVPDRGHGSTGDETIRYEWSGTAGDAVTRTYNGSTVSTVADSVNTFSLSYSTEAGSLQTVPRVLLVTANPSTPSTRESDMITALGEWGFSTQSIAHTCTPGEFTTALASMDVVYLLPEVQWTYFSDKSTTFAQGAVIADTELFSRFGVAASGNQTNTTAIYKTSTVHPVTYGFSNTITYVSSAENLSCGNSIASGADSLATDLLSQPTLFAVDRDDTLISGTAAGRRIAVPSGTSTFEYTELSAEGERIERNAILWAAAPKAIGRVTITLQVGSDTSARIVTDVKLVNLPEAP